MHRFASVLALGALLAFPAGASAQDDMTHTILSVGDRDDLRGDEPLVLKPLSLRECQDDVAVGLRVRNIPSEATFLDFWRSTGADCSDPDVRSDSTQTGCTVIEPEADQNTEGRSEVTLDISANDLVPCTADGTFEIYALATTGSVGSTSEALDWVVIPVEVDTTPPSAPGDIQPLDGEGEVGATWEVSGSNLNRHLIFINPAGCNGGGSDDAGAPVDASGGLDGGSVEDAGMEPDAGTTDDGGVGTSGDLDAFECGGTTYYGEVPAGYECAGTADGTSGSKLVAVEGLAVGQEVGVAVAAVDRADNVSEVAITCATGTDLTGFCDARGGCPDSCNCTVPGGTHGGGAGAAGLGLLVLGLTAVRIRRRWR
ncbi:MAG: MYXO-CTERM sorting domain-containing protein [Myxococcota bacterium]